MKIAIIRKKYIFHGGSERFSHSFIEKMAEAGNEIHIYSISWQTDAPHPNIIFHKVPAFTSISLLRDLSFTVSTYLMLKQQRRNLDIIQTHDKTLYQDIYRAGDGCHIAWLKQRWKRIGAAKKVSIVLNPYHWFVLILERMILKGHRFRKIIAISKMVKKEIVDFYGIAPSDIEVVYNGVDIDRYHPSNREKYRGEIRKRHGLTDMDFVVLFVGSGFERKGVRYLLKAVALIKDPVTVLVVGRGSATGIRKLASHQRVIFCGPREDSYKYYAAAEIFVFPTLYEPFGNVHLEALASGLPVITTRNSGASELIKDGEHGFVVSAPEDLGTIAGGIQDMIHNRDKLEAMKKNARQLAEQFTFESHIKAIKKIYDQL